MQTYHTSIIKQHVESISKLPSHRRDPQDGVHGLCIAGDGRGPEVLDKLADAHQLARCAKRLLCRIERRDGALRPVGAVEVPGKEAREVLEGAEDLVAADCSIAS